MAAVATIARSDVERQKVIDQHWDDRQATLLARMAAVIGAQRAAAAGELDARYVPPPESLKKLARAAGCPGRPTARTLIV